MNGVIHALRDVNLERGRRNEQRFLDAMKATHSPVKMPKWFIRGYHASKKEDRFEGKDAVIETTDAGKLFIQIKSSQAGAQRFKEKKKGKRYSFIGVIVIRDDDTIESIRLKTRKILSKLRQDVFAERSNMG